MSSHAAAGSIERCAQEQNPRTQAHVCSTETMGQCCCCCADAADNAAGNQPARHRARQQPSFPSHQRATRASNACRICGSIIDPALLDGHEESCRAAARRALHHAATNITPPMRDTDPLISAQSATPNRAAADAAAPADLHECVICFEPKAERVAILPCAHMGFCLECAKRVDACPLCRGPKTGVLILREDAQKCRHCKLAIAPVHIDAHQETCRMNQRALSAELRQQERNQAALLPCGHERAGTTVALLPCGCCVCSETCAASASSCPVHLTRIIARVRIFEE